MRKGSFNVPQQKKNRNRKELLRVGGVGAKMAGLKLGGVIRRIGRS